jgi:hypothetical protein
MFIFHIGEPYGLVLPRVILGSLGPSHTFESTLPQQHCMMRLISIEDFARDINENVQSASLILDPPTKRAT